MSADLVSALRLLDIEPLPKWNDTTLLRVLGDVLIERYEVCPEELLELIDKVLQTNIRFIELSRLLFEPVRLL